MVVAMIMVVLEVLVIHSTRYGFYRISALGIKRISALGFKRISAPSFSYSWQFQLWICLQQVDQPWFSTREKIRDLMSPSLSVSFGWPTQKVKNEPSEFTRRVQTPIGYQPTLFSTIPILYTLFLFIFTDLLNVISIMEFQLTFDVKWV